MSVCMSAVLAGMSIVLIKYTGNYVKIYFNMKITCSLLVLLQICYHFWPEREREREECLDNVGFCAVAHRRFNQKCHLLGWHFQLEIVFQWYNESTFLDKAVAICSLILIKKLLF